MRQRQSTLFILAFSLAGLSCTVVAGFIVLGRVERTQLQALARDAKERARSAEKVLDRAAREAGLGPRPAPGMRDTAFDTAVARLGVELQRALEASPGLRGFRIGPAPEILVGFDPHRAVPNDAEIRLDEVLGLTAVRVLYALPGADEPTLTLELQFDAPAWWQERGAMLASVSFSLVVVTLSLYLLAALFVTVRSAEARLRARTRERQQRLDTLGEVARGIAHEVRNPLNTIGLLAQVFERSARKNALPRQDDLARLQGEVRRIQAVVDRFARFARVRALTRRDLDVAELLAGLLRSRADFLAAQGIAHEIGARGDARLSADAAELHDAFTAIVDNAADAIRALGPRSVGRGIIQIDVDGRGQKLKVAIRDDGEGIDPTRLERIFEPFHSTRDGALGLGLSQARSIVEAHGGSIEVRPEDSGVTVVVTLPRERGAESA